MERESPAIFRVNTDKTQTWRKKKGGGNHQVGGKGTPRHSKNVEKEKKCTPIVLEEKK